MSFFHQIRADEGRRPGNAGMAMNQHIFALRSLGVDELICLGEELVEGAVEGVLGTDFMLLNPMR